MRTKYFLETIWLNCQRFQLLWNMKTFVFWAEILDIDRIFTFEIFVKYIIDILYIRTIIWSNFRQQYLSLFLSCVEFSMVICIGIKSEKQRFFWKLEPTGANFQVSNALMKPVLIFEIRLYSENPLEWKLCEYATIKMEKASISVITSGDMCPFLCSWSYCRQKRWVESYSLPNWS